jgi:hypothetical protein
MGHTAWANRVRDVTASQPRSPKTWGSWSTRILVEMHLSGQCMDWIDLYDYREHFRNGLTPTEALQQESENARCKA